MLVGSPEASSKALQVLLRSGFGTSSRLSCQTHHGSGEQGLSPRGGALWMLAASAAGAVQDWCQLVGLSPFPLYERAKG